MKLYVGNLSRDVSEGDLLEAFRVFGKVTQVTIMKNRSKTVSKGFGYVEMPSPDEAQEAIAGLHMKDMKGQSLDVTEEKSRPGQGFHSKGGGRGNRKGRGGRRPW